MNLRRPPVGGLGAAVTQLRLQRERLADSLRQLDDLIAEVQRKADAAPPGPPFLLRAANDEAGPSPGD